MAAENGEPSSVSPPASTSPSTAEHTPTATNSNSTTTTPAERPPPRKRRRVIISCTECHRRKQKCDRNLPCTNCVTRNKQHSCRYEAAAPTARRAREYGSNGGSEEAPPVKQSGRRASKYDVVPSPKMEEVSLVEPRAGTNFGYTGTAAASTLGFLKKIDDGGEELSSRLAIVAGGGGENAYFGTRERYKSLVRQLPARPYIEKCVEIYFNDFNWQYNGLDRYVFDRQLNEWHSLPFHMLNTEGPQAFSPDLRAFPALLFQLIATALMILGPDPDPIFDSLKYNSSMTFDDLATGYSESGMAVLQILGKRQVSHTAVIAGWMRAGFLKYSGLVTESWHDLGAAVRDAQECGLHRDSMDPKPASDQLEDVLENQWEIQRRRKTWCILMTWDIHTGVVLGRPLGIDFSIRYTMPVDAPTPTDPSRTPVTVRSENDPPSLMTRTLYIARMAMSLKDIVALERDGPCPKDFSKVDQMHAELEKLEAETPAYFRRQNPDTRYDDLPGCEWIPLVREQLHPLVWFNFMALHRPYVFTRPHSRTEALRASLKMLDAQKDHFTGLNPRHYKTFQLFFGTFDAIVLSASIFILFPRENTEYITSALQHFQWALQRFEVMSERNRLASAARGVLYAIHTRLQKSLGITPSFSSSPSGLPTKGTSRSSIDAQTTADTASSSLTQSGSSGTRGTSSILTTPEAASEPPPPPAAIARSALPDASNVPIDPSLSGMSTNATTGDWALPGGFDWGSIAPIYAIADIAYNDLMGISSNIDGDRNETVGSAAASTSMPNWAGGTPLLNEEVPASAVGGGDAAVPAWSFGGDFGNDTVWNLLNQFEGF